MPSALPSQRAQVVLHAESGQFHDNCWQNAAEPELPQLIELISTTQRRFVGVLVAAVGDGSDSAFLIAVAILASLIPALRATRVDPMIALRQE